MSDRKDKDDAESPPPDAKKSSGRVAFDERGNSVWEWQLETGVYSRDVNTQKLKKLELDELSIAETAQHRKPTGLGAPEKRSMPGGGFNPYDNSSQREAGGNPYDNASNRTRARQPPPSPPPRPPRSPEDLRKIEEWLKLKKRLDENKARDDDE
ncbi:MAG: hypothetical protein ACREUC_19370 [Steroidobacteraceae bacterium]